MKHTIVAATQNKHKIVEIEAITKEFGMDIISRDEAGVPDIEIVEDGTTFEENSYKKAYEIMKLCGKITIADDSGLEVDCLDGAPGVYSARFAGEDGDDEANNRKLIDLIKDVPYEKRTGRFVSVITMVFPDGESLVARGEVEGHLVLEKKGKPWVWIRSAVRSVGLREYVWRAGLGAEKQDQPQSPCFAEVA